MSDNLFERLTDLSIGTGSQTPLAAIDRIKELEAKLSKSEALLAEAIEDSFFAGFAEGRDGGWVWGDPTPAFKVYIAELKGDEP
jgi:hypothetical protein